MGEGKQHMEQHTQDTAGRPTGLAGSEARAAGIAYFHDAGAAYVKRDKVQGMQTGIFSMRRSGKIKWRGQGATFAARPVISCRPTVTLLFDPFTTVSYFTVGGSVTVWSLQMVNNLFGKRSRSKTRGSVGYI